MKAMIQRLEAATRDDSGIYPYEIAKITKNDLRAILNALRAGQAYVDACGEGDLVRKRAAEDALFGAYEVTPE